VRDPAGYYRNNVAGTLGTLEAMALEGCRSFIFSSTCAVYGEPIETPIRETHPTAPINAYGQTKLAIEHALPHFERAYGIRSIRLRYFNAAGADPDGQLGEDHSPEIHVIPRAFEAASGGAPMEVFGEDYPTPDGTCLRDYIHVTDLADAHVRALARLQQGGASATYNVGTEHPSSVRDVMASVERHAGPAIRPCSTPPRSGSGTISGGRRRGQTSIRLWGTRGGGTRPTRAASEGAPESHQPPRGRERFRPAARVRAPPPGAAGQRPGRHGRVRGGIGGAHVPDQDDRR
jgi:UDP-glucose-4-epimerase GalE